MNKATNCQKCGKPVQENKLKYSLLYDCWVCLECYYEANRYEDEEYDE